MYVCFRVFLGLNPQTKFKMKKSSSTDNPIKEKDKNKRKRTKENRMLPQSIIQDRCEVLPLIAPLIVFSSINSHLTRLKRYCSKRDWTKYSRQVIEHYCHKKTSTILLHLSPSLFLIPCLISAFFQRTNHMLATLQSTPNHFPLRLWRPLIR